MSDDWNRFVRVIRADGSERTLPLAAWTEDLEQRVLEAGGRVVMVDEAPETPETRPQAIPENRAEPRSGGRAPADDFAPAPARAQAPVATMPRRGAGQRDSGQRDTDLAIIQQLLTAADALTPWESEFSGSIARWLESHDTLTDKQRAKAQQILSELD